MGLLGRRIRFWYSNSHSHSSRHSGRKTKSNNKMMGIVRSYSWQMKKWLIVLPNNKDANDNDTTTTTTTTTPIPKVCWINLIQKNCHYTILSEEEDDDNNYNNNNNNNNNDNDKEDE